MTDELRHSLDQRPTGELVEILRDQDTDEWRPEVFPLVEAILQQRGVDTAAVKAAGPVPRETLDFEALQPVASFGSPLEANLCRMALVEAGIDAWLSSEYLADVAPPLGVALGVDVLVHPDALGDARQLLDSIEAGAASLPEEAEACPNCSSTDTAHSRHPDRFSAISSWATASIPLPAGVWSWKCNACGHQWE